MLDSGAVVYAEAFEMILLHNGSDEASAAEKAGE